MIGPKKLSTIRQELQRVLGAAGDDPISLLEKRITASERHGAARPGEGDVLQSLWRFLHGKERQHRGKLRAGVKKG